MHKLVIQDDEGKTTVVPLIRDEITIGRKEGNTIRLTERNVSRKHARIVRGNGSIAIEDLNSYNGVKVNGSRIQGRVSIALTDRIQIGDYLLELKLDNNAQAPSPIGIQPTQPIHSVAPSIVNAVNSGNVPASASASSSGIPTAAPEDAPTTRMDPGHMQQMAQSSPSLPPVAPAVATAVSSPSLPSIGEKSLPPTAAMSIPSIPPGAASIPPGTASMPPGAIPPGTPSIPPGAVSIPPPSPGASPGVGAQPQAAADAVQSGRLVILSRNFAGREYVLDRPALVIGRTEDNDVVINHRSISRHHAKVVQENGRYNIVDLQSSNGVRVNGEEYGKVELRRGDVIDLGHVRLRFVEAGESFVFTDSMAVDVGGGGGGKGMWIAIGAIVVGAILFGVFVIGGGKGGGEPDKDPSPDNSQATTPAVAPTPDAGAKPAPQIDNDELLDAIKRAEGASSDKKWSAAKEAADQALALDPANEKAKAIAEQATREQDNEKLLEELKAIAKRPTRTLADADFQRAAQLFSTITVESAHKEDARAAHDKVMKGFADAASAEANKLIRARKCDEADALADKARELSERAGEQVAAIAAKCSRPVAVQRKPTPRAAPRPGDTTPTPPPDKPSGDDDDDDPPSRRPGKSFKDYLDEAQTATKNGLYSAALLACRNALKLRGSDIEALTTCAVTSCKLNRPDLVKKYMDRIRSNDRKVMIQQVCLRSGVTLN